MDQRIQAQEKAARAKHATFEKRLLDKLEDDQLFFSYFSGEVHTQKYQKRTLSTMRTSVEQLSA
jgi:hypothetical protein